MQQFLGGDRGCLLGSLVTFESVVGEGGVACFLLGLFLETFLVRGESWRSLRH